MKKDRVSSTLRTQVLVVSVLLSTLGLLAFGLTSAVPASAATLSASAAAASPALPVVSIPSAAIPATAEPNAEASAGSAANMVSAAAASPAALAPAAAGDFVFTGKGWGHAVGMSQWGAWYAARNGTSFSDILAFYYPGTTLAPLTDPNTIVKVKISSEPWKSVSSITQDYSRVQLEPTVAPMTLVEHSSAGDASEDIPLGTVVTVTNVAGKVEVSTPAGDEGPFDYVEARPAAAVQPVGDSPADQRRPRQDHALDRRHDQGRSPRVLGHHAGAVLVGGREAMGLQLRAHRQIRPEHRRGGRTTGPCRPPRPRMPPRR